MGHNCSIAALAGVGLEDLARLGITTTGRTITGDEALSEEQPYAAVRDGQLVFACGDPRLVESVEAVAAQLGGRMAGVVFGSTADFYLLHLRDGDRVRELLVHEGEAVESSGEPWVEEAALAEERFTEDGMFAVFHRVTGIEVDDAWMGQEFQELNWEVAGEAAFDDGQEPIEESRYVPVSPVATSYKVTGLALAAGIAFEILLGTRTVTAGVEIGPPVVHVLFVVLAALTLFGGRLSLGRVLWTAAEAAVLLVAVVVAAANEDDDFALLMVFAAYLVALLAVLGWHAVRLRSFERAFKG